MGTYRLRKTAGQLLGLLLIGALMGVGFESAYAQDDKIFTNVYVVPPTFLSSGAGSSTVADPFAEDAPASSRRTTKDVLMDAGVVFGPGASVIYGPATSQLIVRNTKEQLELVEAYIESIKAKAEKQLRIKIEWFELSHKDFSELTEKEDHENAGEKKSSNDGALRDKVLAMVKGDKATAVDTAMIIARSGQRAKVESVLEVIYPTQYTRSKAEATEGDDKQKKTGTKKQERRFLFCL